MMRLILAVCVSAALCGCISGASKSPPPPPSLQKQRRVIITESTPPGESLGAFPQGVASIEPPLSWGFVANGREIVLKPGEIVSSEPWVGFQFRVTDWNGASSVWEPIWINRTAAPQLHRWDYQAEVRENCPLCELRFLGPRIEVCGGNVELRRRLGARIDPQTRLPGFEATVEDVGSCAVISVKTHEPWDYETHRAAQLDLLVHDLADPSIVIDQARIELAILNVNDNDPAFPTETLNLVYDSSRPGKQVLGRVQAHDKDGDQLRYFKEEPDNTLVIVPQTGEIIALDGFNRSSLAIWAQDRKRPSAKAKVQVNFIDQSLFSSDSVLMPELYRVKRRTTRAVRPTKRIEFTEADGEPEGKIVFQLEKESEHETFRIRDENPWVTVEPNGSVRVKKKWDYEELGREKTVDFWVIISNSGTSSGKLLVIDSLH